MSLFSQVQPVIASALRVPDDSITRATRDEDVPSWDSLGQVNLIMALEQTFDIQVEVEDFASLNSVAAILDYLEKAGVS